MAHREQSQSQVATQTQVGSMARSSPSLHKPHTAWGTAFITHRQHTQHDAHHTWHTASCALSCSYTLQGDDEVLIR